MRILYANHTSRISGGEHSLLTLLDGLPTDVQAIVACPEGALAEMARAHDIPVPPDSRHRRQPALHPTRTPRAVFEMGLAAIQLRRLAAAVDADLIHANSIRAGIITAGATRLTDRPMVVHVRDCLPDSVVSTLTLHAIERSADAVIANSEYTRSTLRSGQTTARVVHNAVDLARFDSVGLTRAEARKRLGLEGDGPVLAVIAQITPWKGQDDAIRIVAGLRQAHPNLRLLVVGSAKFDSAATRYDNSAYLEALHRQVEAQQLEDSVSFLGEREDIPEILRAVDLLLVPSWEEPFGRSIVEAMAAAVPVAATNIGGPPEIVREGENGILLSPRRPDVWITAIEKLLADSPRLAEMGIQGRDDARRRFGVERHVTEVLSVYRDVLRDAGVA